MTITWRTVTGPSIADALKPMEAAQDSFNSMFGNFNAQLEKRQAANTFQKGLREEEAVQGYLDQIHGADLNQLEGMRQSGQLNQLRQGLSAAARARVRGEDEARIGALRNQTMEQDKFQDYGVDREQAPMIDRILARAYSGDVAGANAEIDAIPDLRQQATLRKQLYDHSQALLGDTREATRFDREGQSHASNLVTAGQNQDINRFRIGDLTEAEQTRNRNKEVQGMFDAGIARHQEQVTGAKSNIEAVAGELARLNPDAIALNPDGTLNLKAMTSAQREFLDQQLTEQGLPTTSIYESGDTAATQAFEREMRAAGMKPSEFKQAMAQHKEGFSTAPAAAIGNDAATADYRTRLDTLEEEDAFARFGLSSDSRGMESLVNSVSTIAGKLEHPQVAQAVAMKWLGSGGVKGEDGVRIMPSPAELERILMSVDATWANGDKGFWTPWNAKKVYEQALKDWVKENTGNAAQSYSALQRRERRKILEE